MLRITAKREGGKTRVLYLEGKICQEWVKELKSEIKKGMSEEEKIILDFSKVGYIDEKAADMINQLPLRKVKKRNCSLFIRTMLRMENRGEK